MSGTQGSVFCFTSSVNSNMNRCQAASGTNDAPNPDPFLPNNNISDSSSKRRGANKTKRNSSHGSLSSKPNECGEAANTGSRHGDIVTLSGGDARMSPTRDYSSTPLVSFWETPTCSRKPMPQRAKPRTRSCTTIWSLPEEMLLSVFRHLHVTDLLSMSQVSSYFNELISESSELWAHVRFTKMWPSLGTNDIFVRATTFGNFEARMKCGIAFLYNEGFSSDADVEEDGVEDTTLIYNNAYRAAVNFLELEKLQKGKDSPVCFTWLLFRPPWSEGLCCKRFVYDLVQKKALETGNMSALVGMARINQLATRQGCPPAEELQQAEDLLKLAASNRSAEAAYRQWKNMYKWDSAEWRVGERALDVRIQMVRSLRDVLLLGSQDLAQLDLCSLYASGYYGLAEPAVVAGTVQRYMAASRPPQALSMFTKGGVTPSMRYILVDWLIEVTSMKVFSTCTLHMCVNIVDRFLMKQTVERHRLQLLGVVAMILSSRYTERDVMTIYEACWLTDGAYEYKDVVHMIGEILSVLRGKVRVPTTIDYLQLHLQIVRYPEAKFRKDHGLLPPLYSKSTEYSTPSLGRTTRRTTRRLTASITSDVSESSSFLQLYNMECPTGFQARDDYGESCCETALSAETAHMSEYYCEMALLQPDGLKQAPARLAASCYLLAALTTLPTRDKDVLWPIQSQTMTGFSLDDLKESTLQLHSQCFGKEAPKDHRNVALKAVHIRYAAEDFSKVSSMQPVTCEELERVLLTGEESCTVNNGSNFKKCTTSSTASLRSSGYLIKSPTTRAHRSASPHSLRKSKVGSDATGPSSSSQSCRVQAPTPIIGDSDSPPGPSTQPQQGSSDKKPRPPSPHGDLDKSEKHSNVAQGELDQPTHKPSSKTKVCSHSFLGGPSQVSRHTGNEPVSFSNDSSVEDFSSDEERDYDADVSTLSDTGFGSAYGGARVSVGSDAAGPTSSIATSPFSSLAQLKGVSSQQPHLRRSTRKGHCHLHKNSKSASAVKVDRVSGNSNAANDSSKTCAEQKKVSRTFSRKRSSRSCEDSNRLRVGKNKKKRRNVPSFHVYSVSSSTRSNSVSLNGSSINTPSCATAQSSNSTTTVTVGSGRMATTSQGCYGNITRAGDGVGNAFKATCFKNAIGLKSPSIKERVGLVDVSAGRIVGSAGDVATSSSGMLKILDPNMAVQCPSGISRDNLSPRKRISRRH